MEGKITGVIMTDFFGKEVIVTKSTIQKDDIIIPMTEGIRDIIGSIYSGFIDIGYIDDISIRLLKEGDIDGVDLRSLEERYIMISNIYSSLRSRNQNIILDLGLLIVLIYFILR